MSGERETFQYCQFTDHLEPSLASMDTEGRVLRLDSFSKVMTPGLRIGYATGPRPLIDKLEKHMQVLDCWTLSLEDSKWMRFSLPPPGLDHPHILSLPINRQ